MKFDILHRTRYIYASPVRDSFNDVRLEPPSIPEQTVQSFLLRVLPAVRLKHYTDFYSNWIHHFEIPARYVSGYLATEAASATHAWVEVYIPGTGWRALDPTHNRQIGETYVKIGHGRDYGDVPPVSGNYRGTLQRTMEVEVKITEIE